MKNNGCNHVKCATCGTEYCFACSANRTIILSHGLISIDLLIKEINIIERDALTTKI